MTKRIFVKGDKKVLRAWAFYDWANSVYPLVIGTAVFPIFYGELFVESDYIDFLGINYKNTALIQHITSLVFLLAPFGPFLFCVLIDVLEIGMCIAWWAEPSPTWTKLFA